MVGFLLKLAVASVVACLAAGGLIDRGQDIYDARNYPLVQGFIRIELHISRLDTRGRSQTGLPCDITDQCDPRVIAFIDTERPNHDFGGDSVPYANYATLHDANNVDIPLIGKTISRDICGRSVRKVALRVRAIDKDMFNDDTIDNYKCFITGDNPPAENESLANWSEEIACAGEERKSSKVYMKYRWYRINEATCRPSSNGRGPFSGFLSR
ncbi:hypothetical protein BV898_04754 [Hypsibius exemplaris]|uniref:Uncharacterized protein n=1 Tax=Hypsibius exemplaris TaxID=2072580 RepID=A0A1W0X1E6_HYPEX|nr:hypothetical protein BV898_04754 [Hypsibius exemplaris]